VNRIAFTGSDAPHASSSARSPEDPNAEIPNSVNPYRSSICSGSDPHSEVELIRSMVVVVEQINCPRMIKHELGCAENAMNNRVTGRVIAELIARKTECWNEMYTIQPILRRGSVLDEEKKN